MKNSTKTHITDLKSNNSYYIDNCQIMDDFDKVKMMPIKIVKKCLESMNAGDDEAFLKLSSTIKEFKNNMINYKLMSDALIYQASVGMILLWLCDYPNVLSNYDVVVERAVAICENNQEIILDIFTMNKKGDDQHQLFLVDESLAPIFDKVFSGEYETKEWVDPYQQAFEHFLNRIKK